MFVIFCKDKHLFYIVYYLNNNFDKKESNKKLCLFNECGNHSQNSGNDFHTWWFHFRKLRSVFIGWRFLFLKSIICCHQASLIHFFSLRYDKRHTSGTNFSQLLYLHKIILLSNICLFYLHMLIVFDDLCLL